MNRKIILGDMNFVLTTTVSNGNGPYYRYHYGENKLTPSQQRDILQILSKFGSTDNLAFDHYETDFDLG